MRGIRARSRAYLHSRRGSWNREALPHRRMVVRPFIGTEALAAGTVNRYQLATRHTALHRNVYVPKGVELTAVDRAIGAWLWSGRKATVAGMSAAALHG